MAPFMRAIRASHAPCAAAACVLAHSQHTSKSQPAAQPTGVIVLFRHGARAPVFGLPDSPIGELEYKGLTSAPAHAVPVTINGGGRYAKPQHGMLTAVGWAQGEALGRMLRVQYGAPHSADVVVQSTDVSRTVLTARAVLTGLLLADSADGTEAPLPPVQVTIDESSTLAVNTQCAALAATMSAGRSVHRATDVGHARCMDAIASTYNEYGFDRGDQQLPTVLRVYDDCIARRFFGHEPSRAVHVALCDWVSREVALEVRAALREGGLGATRLSAGKMCGALAAHLRDLRDLRGARDAGGGPRFVLLSGHDTSMLMLLNALDRDGERVELGVWPPHTSHITVELYDDDSVRVCYGGGASELVERGPAAAFLRRLDALSITSEELRRLCGPPGSASFHWHE